MYLVRGRDCGGSGDRERIYVFWAGMVCGIDQALAMAAELFVSHRLEHNLYSRFFNVLFFAERGGMDFKLRKRRAERIVFPSFLNA